MNNTEWLDAIAWNDDGLIPVIAQAKDTGKVLMLAWMNKEALQQSIASGFATYWSRSRQKIWQKGESSGHVQLVEDVRLDCDKDAILLTVSQQHGIACHTGRESCFFQRLQDNAWISTEPVIKDPKEIYQHD